MGRTEVSTVDYHTGGEPFRIVVDVPPLRGETVAAKRVHAARSDAVDGLRALLCSEPRGHADMYGGFITEPDDDGAHFGVLFWHKDGFSTACGHGTIALGAWAINTGRVPITPGGVTEVMIDVPSGRVVARVTTDPEDRVTSVDFVNVASYVLHERVDVDISAGRIVTLISFGGAIYAEVDVAAVGLSLTAADLPALIAISREIKDSLRGTEYDQHPSDPRLSGIYGVAFLDDLGQDEAGNPVQRNVVVFADGEVDRSPTGSATSARVATLAAAGRLADDQQLVNHSIVGSTFIGRVVGHTVVGDREAVLPMVTGTAYQTGVHTFVVDPADDMTPGFVLR